jgi:hypothetical protein
VPAAVEAVNVTPAYLFRKVGDSDPPPTILFDEIDTVFGPKAKDNEEIRGLLNAGHRRGAVAGRCVVKGKLVVTEEIPAFCAVAMAGLGGLPDTLLSRSVVVRMRRRTPGEQVEPFRQRIHGPEGEEIAAGLETWAAGVLEDAGSTHPAMPSGEVDGRTISIEDRDADVWEPLLAVATLAGGEWPERAAAAAVALVADSKESTPSLGIRLLQDLRHVFGAEESLSTKVVLERLNALEEAPWGDLRGRPLDARSLAMRLRPYNVRSKNLNQGGGTVLKGYSREDLHDPWKRYLGPPPQESATSATAAAGDTDARCTL